MDYAEYIDKKMKEQIYAGAILQQQAFDNGTIINLKGNFQTTHKTASVVTGLSKGAAIITGEKRDRILGRTSVTTSNVSETVAVTAPSSGTSILSMVRSLLTTFSGTTVTPTSGGALTINSQSVGLYEYCISSGGTISSFTASDWFSTTADTTSSWIIVNGNLTINSGQTFTPSVRKLFTVLYVSGNLTVNGTISMTARGANHSGLLASGGYTEPVNIRIGTGTFSAISNPQIPSSGGAGGALKTVSGYNHGSAGSSGGSGGGGTGECFSGASAGAGGTGTCFSGGTGSGGAFAGSGTSGAGGANGGKGGDKLGSTYTGGGTGNPGGLGTTDGGTTYTGISGTGGTLIIICAGTFSGSGTISTNGSTTNRPPGAPGGGASGGGSVTILYGTDSSSITPIATGGTGVGSGNGGAGTARKLAIASN